MSNNTLNFFNPIDMVSCWGVLLFLLSFVSKRKHLLSTLLSLEGVMLMMFIMVAQLGAILNFYNFLLIFLSLVACEGALGLSLLVLIVRNNSSDFFKSMNSLKC